MLIPPYLKPGDTIGITCPSGYIAEERVRSCAQLLEQKGYRVRIGKTVGNGSNYFAGTDAERLADLQSMLDDGSIQAILMGRGGYGLSRIIDQADFTAFCKNPKWICGFSDITILHSHIQANFTIATLHSPMCGAFNEESKDSYYIQSFFDALEGRTLQYRVTPQTHNRYGSASAPLVGGNLCILVHLSGSTSAIDTHGKILFIEDIGEHLYAIDRLLYNLKRSGRLEGIKGLVVGQFTDTQDTERPFGKTLEEIISDITKDGDYPVMFGLPCGHDKENVSLILGADWDLHVNEQGASLKLLPGAANT